MAAEVNAAKQRLLVATRDRSWCAGVGVGLVDAHVGLVLSVRPGAGEEAAELVDRLALGVPVRVREVGEIRARALRGGALGVDAATAAEGASGDAPTGERSAG